MATQLQFARIAELEQSQRQHGQRLERLERLTALEEDMDAILEQIRVCTDVPTETALRTALFQKMAIHQSLIEEVNGD